MRSDLYMIYKACDRIDPRRLYSKGFFDLTPLQQRHILGWDATRAEEDEKARTYRENKK